MLSSALRQWRGAHGTHRNAATFAAHYHSAQVQYGALLAWRLQLRARLKMLKQARIAQKFFVHRRCFKMWRVRVREERLEKRRREFEARVVRRYFDGAFCLGWSGWVERLMLMWGVCYVRLGRGRAEAETAEGRGGDHPGAH